MCRCSDIINVTSTKFKSNLFNFPQYNLLTKIVDWSSSINNPSPFPLKTISAFKGFLFLIKLVFDKTSLTRSFFGNR